MARARKKPEEQAPETQDEEPVEAGADELRPSAGEAGLAPTAPPEPAAEEPTEAEPGQSEGPAEEPVAVEPAPPEAPAEEAVSEEPVAAEPATPEAPAKPAKKPASRRVAKPRPEKTEKPKIAARKPRAAAKRTAERKPIVRLPRPARPRGQLRERRGIVVSDAMEKTIVVRVDTVRPDRSYRKIVRHSRKLHAHDERNEAKVGDLVRVVETRPVSRTKSWRLAEVLEAAK